MMRSGGRIKYFSTSGVIGGVAVEQYILYLWIAVHGHGDERV
jgi:hypothetical protein